MNDCAVTSIFAEVDNDCRPPAPPCAAQTVELRLSIRQGARRGSIAIELFISLPLPPEVTDEYFQKANNVIAVSGRCLAKELAHLVLDARHLND
jgi:hypothetical protein